MPATRKPDTTRTKTIATVGPACDSVVALTSLLDSGVDVFRINMAHGDRAQHQEFIDSIRRASSETGLPVGIMVDLAGPKIRLGQLFEDPVRLENDSHVWFVRGQQSTAALELVCSYESLIDELEEGDQIMLCDGLVRLEADQKDPDRIRCRVVDGGEVRSRQGVNLPGANLGVPALLDVDKGNAVWAAENRVEFVSLSFVRRASEVGELKQLLADHHSPAMVIAKIEKREALDNLEAIVDASDAVMVARGDLGVEIEIEKTPLAQKRIIKMCQNLGKPVIVATQMLESMRSNRQPTRAEASDVANAILDGADACMLSGETAIGDYPKQTVNVMQKIKFETEQMLAGRPSRKMSPERIQNQGVSEAVVFGAAHIARQIQAQMVVLATANGTIALVKSKQRDFIPTVAVTDQRDVLNRMCLLWGITPAFLDDLSGPSLHSWLAHWSRENDRLAPGDKVVIVLDTEMSPGVHDTVVVTQVPTS